MSHVRTITHFVRHSQLVSSNQSKGEAISQASQA